MKISYYQRMVSALILLGLCTVGCGSVSIQSHWRQNNITIDGKDNEWQSIPNVEKDDISFKAMNDEKYLYLCLASSSREVKRQISGAFKQNITLWLDPQHKKSISGGLRLVLYPDHSIGYPRRDVDESDYLNSASHVLSIEVPGREGYPHILTADSTEAAASLSMEHGRLVMEFKIPLNSETENSHALGAQPGQMISLGFVSSEIDSNAASEELAHERETKDSEKQGGGRRGSGMGGMGGMGGGGGGGGGGHHHGGGGESGDGPPRQTPGEPDNFELWSDLKLAQPPEMIK